MSNYTTSATIGAGDIFSGNGEFFQVVKASACYVTVKEIESEFIGYVDDYGWERAYMPVKDAFVHNPWFSETQNANGKRVKVRDFSQAKNQPVISPVGSWQDCTLWDGQPSIHDSYN